MPYKPKRKTKASVAREKGLEPLALCILEQDQSRHLNAINGGQYAQEYALLKNIQMFTEK